MLDFLHLLRGRFVEYIDIDLTLWLTWCLTPLIVTFLLPLIIVILFYFTAFTLYIYKLHWRNIKDTLSSGDRWEAGRKFVGAVWDAHGWIWHSYEIDGLENIPDSEPALIIYYHGAIPIDIYYFLAKVYFLKNRMVHTVADNFLFKFSGFGIIADCMKVVPGTIQSCANILKEGNVLAISPGGVYEAQFSRNYNLMWKKRFGFAKVAIEAKVKIIPMYTENLREAFRTVGIGRRIFLKLYAKFKLPFAPVYGGFPVKLVSHIGKPIDYDPNLTPEELQKKVSDSLEELIQRHQRLPGSILMGLMDRIPYFRKRFPKNSHDD
ncbi:transmembrane protein 68 isoform X1 [Coccinella septempunctata]|uniref:transmembrane protein 68 isoform X1 n=1 Tax=Coccinella septempunctata TaxID=41139 RepID=UPI001D09384B|nr:transmembrane protein 68 isoform X1 [Coccinella septempunctata]